tara:strand:- start:3572 stop:4429 length:858 start_codon:yes stop_codon:yes gene_type:complete
MQQATTEKSKALDPLISQGKNSSQPNAKTLSNDAAWLYHGNVMHSRISPKQHRFQYSVFSLLVDVDRLEDANKLSSIFSVSKFNLVSFYPSDHLAKDSELTLREQTQHIMSEHGIDWQPKKILLACYPRILGKVFNPLSVFYIYQENDIIGAIIYEVRNTFGEKHLYVCPIEEKNLTPDHIKQEAEKNFYVSPFIEMNMRYFFTISEPYQTMSWRILEKQDDTPVLAATYFGRQKVLNTKNLARFFLQIPLLTWKILIGIHFEAVRLWLKGLRYVPRKRAEKSSV